MMTKLVSAAAVLAIAGSALAQGSAWNFRGTLDLGNSPLVVGGVGIVPSTSFFNDGFGNTNGGPNPAFIGQPFAPNIAFDSYWAVGSGPTTAENPNANSPYAGSGLPFVATADKAESNGGFATPGVGADATLKEVNGVEGWALFIGRLTTIGEGSELLTKDGGSPFGSIGIFNGGGQTPVQMTLNGAGVAGPGGLDGSIQQTYWFVSEVTETTLADGTAIRVHDLYFTTAIPTPGAVALFGLAGLAAARRRRA
jgi:hypothetical protein